MRFENSIGSEGQLQVPALLEATFPTDFEAKLVGKLREADALVEEHGLFDGDRLIGHVAYSPVAVKDCVTDKTLLGLGPMAIHPAHQGSGLGLRFLKDSVNALNADAVILLGHIGFYDKAGFGPASDHGLYFTKDPKTEKSFMVQALTPGALEGTAGQVIYHAAFYEEDR